MRGCARLTRTNRSPYRTPRKPLAELKQRLARAMDYVKGFTPAQFEGADAREVTFPIGGGKTDHDGPAVSEQLLAAELLLPRRYRPGILRHSGIEIGKRDFLGAQ